MLNIEIKNTNYVLKNILYFLNLHKYKYQLKVIKVTSNDEFSSHTQKHKQIEN